MESNLPATPYGHNAVGYVQSKAGSLSHSLGGEEGVKDSALYLMGHTRAIVGDLHRQIIILAVGPYCEGAAFADGVESVVKKVHPNLVEFAGPHLDSW